MKNSIAVITGMGAVSACGHSLSETLDTFSAGKRNGGPVTLFPTKLANPVFEVKNLSKYKPDSMRSLDLVIAAVDQAIAESGLSGSLGDFRVGVCLGTTVASQLNDTDFYREYKTTGSASMNSVDRYLNGNLSDAVAAHLGIEGPRCTVVNACSSGTDAIGMGLSWLRSDLCDMVICGGADELNRVPYVGFGSLSVVSPDLCRPFDRDRSGLNLGEGAGILVIEKENTAVKRGIKSDLAVNGYGLACDAHHLTAPRPDGSGLKKALNRAFIEAGITPSDVSFINAHGTSTIDNDKVEGKVLADVFGPDVTFLSTKGFTGHTLGAAGGLEAVFTALGLRHGWIPASPGFNNIDENIGVAPVRQKTEIKGKYAVSTSLAFGGNNSALVISRK